MPDEYFKLLERMVKGAEMIESTTDPNKKAYYQKIYDHLDQELEQIKEREADHDELERRVWKNRIEDPGARTAIQADEKREDAA